MATVPTVEQLRTHLNFNEPTDTSHDAEVLDMLAAAIEVLEHDPDFPLVADALIDGQEHPALRFALMEFVRDMWTGTQTGGAFDGNALSDDVGGPVLTAGRPVLPPYVRGLLGPYRAKSTGPAFSFPAAPTWPCS
jgi:hypothetical protein